MPSLIGLRIFSLNMSGLEKVSSNDLAIHNCLQYFDIIRIFGNLIYYLTFNFVNTLNTIHINGIVFVS